MLNSVVAPNVPTSNRFAPLAHPGIEADAPDTQRPGPSRTPPARIFNATTSPMQAPRRACPREAALVDALERSSADEAQLLLKLLKEGLEKAATREERDAVLQRYEKAVADRTASMAFPSDFLLNMANAGMERAFWRTLGGAAPGIGGALALLQLARSAAHRSWSEVAPLVPTLVAMLPSLRNAETIDAWIQSMPATLREQLEHLHQWVQQTDDALTPDLQLQHLGPALAVAAVLWQLKSHLPSPSGQLQGMADLIANLPKHWQKLASLDRIGGALLAAPVGPNALSVVGEAARLDTKRKTPEEKAARAAYQRRFDGQFGPNGNRTAVPPFDTTPFDAKQPPPKRVAPSDFEAARAPGQPKRGGDIADPPRAEPDAATSGIGSMVSSWLTWLTGGTVAFTQLAQTDVGSEMVAMTPGAGGNYGVPLQEVSVQTPLMDHVVPTVSGAIAGRGSSGILKRTAMFSTIAGVIAGTVYGGKRIVEALTGGTNEPPTALELADALAQQVVSVGDAWGTGLDLLLGVPELQTNTRRKRDVSDNQSGRTTGAPATGDTAQLGLTPGQQDALLADNHLRNHLLTLQTWSLAVAQDLATQAGWQWVAQLPPSEQELLVSQLHVLRKLQPALDSMQAQPQTLLDQALVNAGWTGDSTGITVDLGSTQVVGVTVRQQMPLLEYCLLRADGKAPQANFLREGHALSESEQQTLLDFLGSSACAQLGDEVRTHAESMRPTLVDALKARLVIDAIKAKWQGGLGDGNTHLRGAEIVLGYLQGKADVESSTLIYSDTLGDGTLVKFSVPNYLVLRSASTDEGVHGQVVLYRADLATFQSFDSESAFRQFLDTQRAAAGLHVKNGAIDLTLVQDIVAAAPPAYRMQLQDRASRWEQGQTLFQSGKHGPKAWNAADGFLFDFKPCTEAQHTLEDWAGALVSHGQTRQERQLAHNRLRWSPLGLAHVATDEAFNHAMKHDLQSLQGHAHAAVQTGLEEALRRAGYGDTLKGIDPDHVQLTLNGQTMSLTAWATSGWQQHGLAKPVLPLNIGDVPGEGIGVPVDPQPLSPWPDSTALFDLDVIVHRVDGAGVRTRDEASTEQLQEEDARRAICNLLAEFADNNALGDAYTDHLKQLATQASSPFHTAVANQIRVHTAWMIELARRNGEIDADTYMALKRARRSLDAPQSSPSSLHGVTLNGHAINGVWSLKADGRQYVFVPGTATGDRLLEETAFRRWLKEPEAEDYVLAHSALRYHDSLKAMFAKMATKNGIRLAFATTLGPRQAAQKYIQARIMDVDEMTMSQLERFAEGMTLVASVVAALSCSLATAGTAAGLCIASTLALVGDAIARGADYIDRNDIDGAIGEIGGSVMDVVDLTDILKIPTLLFQLGRRGLNTATEARDALRQWHQQARGFSIDGRVNAAFATSRRSLSDSGLPMLKRRDPDGAPFYSQGSLEFIQQDGQFVRSSVAEGENTRRLHMPDAPEQVGPPVEYREGQWQRTKPQRDTHTLTTPRTSETGAKVSTPVPPSEVHPWVQKVPEAGNLPPEKLNELEAVFGIRRPGTTPSPDLRQKVRDLAMNDRIQQIVDDPDSLGLPGDEPMLMRAWADSALLGNGKSVETFVQDGDEWTRGARFGKGPVGMLVEVGDSRQLPGIQQLIDASDIDALLNRLGLPQDSSKEALFAAVKAELAATIAKGPAQSFLSWQRWMNAQHRLPTAPDNLIKHYPQLTKMEAEALTASDRLLAHQVLSWIFTSETAKKVADVIAKRTKREQREAVLQGRLDSPSKVMELESHLQGVLPGRSWRVQSDPAGQGSVLSFSRPDENGNTIYSLTFAPDGEMHRSTGTGREPVSTWEQGIYELLSPTGKENVASSHALRNSVVERMKDTPLVTSCSLPKLPGQKTKRSADCDPPPGISLSEQDVSLRDELGGEMKDVRNSMAERHAQLVQEEAEYKELARKVMDLKKKKETLDPASQARLRELEKKAFGNLKGFDTMNFASYNLQDLSYKGVPVILANNFPLRGTAPSGSPRPAIATDGVLDGTPVRRVFVPESEALNNPTLSGWYRDDYAMGADLTPVQTGRGAEQGQASTKITLTEKDLVVTKPGTRQKVPLNTLTDEEILKLDLASYSPMLRKYVGDAGLLPSNARGLTPGDYRVYQIRSCSEGKILDSWFDALSTALPEIATMLHGSANGPIASLKGKFHLVSEMNPCEVSCNRRLEELMILMQEVEFHVFYLYENNAHRREWSSEQKVNRIVERNRDAWEAEGATEPEMRVRAEEEMKKPDVRQWLEEEFERRPMDQPVPRLWVPTEIEAF